jgi:hypothetical protein
MVWTPVRLIESPILEHVRQSDHIRIVKLPAPTIWIKEMHLRSCIIVNRHLSGTSLVLDYDDSDSPSLFFKFFEEKLPHQQKRSRSVAVTTPLAVRALLRWMRLAIFIDDRSALVTARCGNPHLSLSDAYDGVSLLFVEDQQNEIRSLCHCPISRE